MAVDETADDGSAMTVLVAGKDTALPAGVSQVDFDAALAVGREKGQLTPDELIEALHNVELTPEVLGALLERINAEGVALVEDDLEVLTTEIEDRAQSRATARANAPGANGSRRKTNAK